MARRIQIRVDDDAEAALAQLCASGRTESEAVRFALMNAAARELEAAAADLATDAADHKEVAKVRSEFDALTSPKQSR